MKAILILVSTLFLSSLTAMTAQSLKERMSKEPPEWMTTQISADMSSISPPNVSESALDSIMNNERFNDLLLVRFQIKNNQVNIHSKTPDVAGCGRIWQLLQGLQELVRLSHENGTPIPDCDFIISLHDHLSNYDGFDAAVFSFAKSESVKRIILFPDTDVLSFGDNYQDQAKRGNEAYPWNTKVDQAFWRGVTTGAIFTAENYKDYPRFQLVGLSLCYPKYIDARFTEICQGVENFRDQIPQYIGRSITIPEHMRHKYQILVDGNSCAYSRAYWELFSNSVIMKQQSSHIQWYYKALKPNVHYIPVASDFHDLIQVINWARANDEVVFKISQNAQSFANDNLTREDIFHYMYLAFKAYCNVQQSKAI